VGTSSAPGQATVSHVVREDPHLRLLHRGERVLSRTVSATPETDGGRTEGERNIAYLELCERERFPHLGEVDTPAPGRPRYRHDRSGARLRQPDRVIVLDSLRCPPPFTVSRRLVRAAGARTKVPLLLSSREKHGQYRRVRWVVSSMRNADVRSGTPRTSGSSERLQRLARGAS